MNASDSTAGILLPKYRRLVLFEMSSGIQDICNTLVDMTQGLGKRKPFCSSGWSLGVSGASLGSRGLCVGNHWL